MCPAVFFFRNQFWQVDTLHVLQGVQSWNLTNAYPNWLFFELLFSETTVFFITKRDPSDPTINLRRVSAVLSQMLNVWNIYLHLGGFGDVGKYTIHGFYGCEMCFQSLCRFSVFCVSSETKWVSLNHVKLVEHTFRQNIFLWMNTPENSGKGKWSLCDGVSFNDFLQYPVPYP